MKEEKWNLPRLPSPGHQLSPGDSTASHSLHGARRALSAQVWWAGHRWGGLCLMLSQQAGVSHLPCSHQPPLPEAGFFSFSLALFWADFPERLSVGSTLTSKSAFLPDSQSPHPFLGLVIHPPPPPTPTEPAAGSPAYCSLPLGRPWPGQLWPQHACAALLLVSRAPHWDVEVPGQGEQVLLSPSGPEWSAKCFEPLMSKELRAAGWDPHPSGWS